MRHHFLKSSDDTPRMVAILLLLSGFSACLAKAVRSDTLVLASLLARSASGMCNLACLVCWDNMAPVAPAAPSIADAKKAAVYTSDDCHLSMHKGMVQRCCVMSSAPISLADHA